MNKCILTITAKGEFDSAATRAYKFYVDNISSGLTGSEPPKAIPLKSEIKIVLYRQVNQEIMTKISNELTHPSIDKVSFAIKAEETETFDW